ncbi:GNAT family N-acetyltransferase [Paenibacillus athensensis]|uniref:N-acetyltransferase domain-containing protein n=1 Tax=Paenibacillus athensensis TaxID=1967502 RepID=A0A4Y8Q022_9BACL|nr:GNAT family N-acetyltransferase [Paenibacillus athensensis]MCD1261078.1 GNAT family N-acetyltransferase [Paenibacillus athensensis]
MGITKLDLQTNAEALELLALQAASYRVEAERVGLAEAAPLPDGIASLRQSGERFYGFLSDDATPGRLVGAVSWTRAGCVVTVCRMMVHPDYFRRGIARALLKQLLAEQRRQGASRFVVTTAAANLPAIALYESFGFMPRCSRTIVPCVVMTTLELVL